MNLAFQAAAVGLRAITVFIFIYIVSKDLDSSKASIVLANFTYSSIFAQILCFGMDFSLVQQNKLKTDLYTLLLKILIGFSICLPVMIFQSASQDVLILSIALSLALIFKGLVRLHQLHKEDFIINFSSLIILILLNSTLLNFKTNYIENLAIALFVPNMLAVVKFINISNQNASRAIIVNDIFISIPLVIYSLIMYLTLNIDVYVFDYLNKTESYQSFTIANRFFLNLTMASVILSNYRMPSVIREKEKEKDTLNEFLVLGLGLSVCAYFFSPPLIKLISSDNVTLSALDRFLFSAIVLFRSINTFYGILILKKLSNWTRLFFGFIVLIAHIGLLFFFIDLYDWQGAIYALCISSLTFLSLNFFALKLKI